MGAVWNAWNMLRWVAGNRVVDVINDMYRTTRI